MKWAAQVAASLGLVFFASVCVFWCLLAAIAVAVDAVAADPTETIVAEDLGADEGFAVIATWTPQSNEVIYTGPKRYDDGVVYPPGCYVPPSSDTKPTAVKPTCKIVRYRYYCRRGNGWWMRGPVRRLVSWPFRVWGCRRR